jgi:hypothetical protein
MVPECFDSYDFDYTTERHELPNGSVRRTRTAF